jgi:hypothetical protein
MAAAIGRSCVVEDAVADGEDSVAEGLSLARRERVTAPPQGRNE